MLLIYLLGEAFNGRGYTPTIVLFEYFLRIYHLTIWVGYFTTILESDYNRHHYYLHYNEVKNNKRKMRRARKRHKKGIHGRRPTVRYKGSYADGFANYMSFNERKHGIQHRFFHILHYADHFEQACKANKDFITLFGLSYLGNMMTRDYAYYFGHTSHVNISTPQACDNDENFISFKALYHAEDDRSKFPIIFDTGATTSITPNKEDFISYTPIHGGINGISETTHVEGEGIVEWKIRDDKGKLHRLQVFAKHVPQARVRLYSVQAHL